MARSNFVQSSFRQGEWSPFSQGRIDEDEYYAALNLCADFQPVDAGALIRRSGSQFVATIDPFQGGTTAYVQIIPFDTDDGNHYVCVLTPGNIQFFNGGTFSLAGTAVGLESISTDLDPAVFTTDAAHGLSIGDLVTLIPTLSEGTASSREFANVQLEVDTVPTTTTFTASYAGARSGDGAVGSELACFFGNTDVGKIAQLTLPQTVAQLIANAVKYTQDSDFLYLFHPQHVPQLIDQDFTLTTMQFADGPFFAENEETTTLALSGTTGTVTVTASSIVGINGGVGFVSTDVGRHIRFQDTAGNWTWLIITVVGSTTSVTATIEGNDAGAGTAVTTWRLGLFSNTTGWPVHGVFHELRLWLCSDAQTKRVDGSNIILDKQTPDGAFRFSLTSQDGTVADRHSPSYIFNATGRNRINWLSVDDTGLLAGTSDGVWLVSASAQDDPLTPTSVQARRKTRFKSADKLPDLVNRSTVFIGALEKEVIEIRRYQAGYDAKNVSRDGEHLLSDGLEEIYYANSPIPTLWGRTSTKRLIGASFRRDVDGEQTGWHQHNMEYALDPTKTATEGNVEAITVVRQSDKDNSNIDTLWMVNERGGNFCLEYMTPLFDQSRIDLEGFFVDGGVAYDTSNFSTEWALTDPVTNEYSFYGLWHLEGKEVDVVFRTLDLGTATVSNGQVDIVVPPAALGLPASYQTFADVASDSWTIDDYTRTFNTGYLSDNASVSFLGNGLAFVESTDGNIYKLDDNSGGEVFLTNIQTGTRTQCMSIAQNYADLAAVGQDPAGQILANGISASGTDLGCSFAIRGTPYVVFMGQWPFQGGSPASYYGVHYYRCDGPDIADMVYVGGYMDRVPNVASHDYPNITAATQVTGAHFLETGTGTENASIILSWGPWDGDADEFYVLKLPSVNEAIAQGFSFDLTTHSTRQSPAPENQLITDRINSAAFAQDHPWANRVFFAPVQNGTGAYLMTHTSRMMVEGGFTGTDFINESNTSFPNGWVGGNLWADDADGISGAFGANAEIMNCRIRNEGASIVPFSDAGQNHLGNFTDDADDYQNPFFFPIDVTDPNKPWIVFWPKIYYSSETIGDTGTFLGLRICQWNPITRIMTQLENREGSLFDMTDDLGVSKVANEVQDIALYWDQSDGTIYIASAYSGAGQPVSPRTVFSQFGTFVVDVSADSTDLVQQEALNRGFDATIGLNYVSQAQLLRPQRGSNGGPDLGKTRRVDQYAMITHRTGPFKIGTEFGDDNLESVTPDETILETGQRPLFTGVVHGTIADDYGFNGQIAWEIDRPGPGSFLAVGGFRNTQDR